MTLRNRVSQKSFDAIVIGSGPNSLAAAIAIAQQKRTVLVLEAQPTLGGGARTAELTLPGYLHDICSAIHPMALATFRDCGSSPCPRRSSPLGWSDPWECVPQ